MSFGKATVRDLIMAVACVDKDSEGSLDDVTSRLFSGGINSLSGSELGVLVCPFPEHGLGRGSWLLLDGK